MDRLIEVKVNGNHLSKDNNLAGVQGEGNVTALRIEFDPGWDSFAKKITWFNALGENPVTRTLTADLLEDITASTRIYIVLIPGEPLAEAGNCTIVIEGWIDGKRQRSVDTSLRVKAAPDTDNAGEPVDPTPTQAEQLQAQIDNLLGDIQEQAVIAHNAAETAGGHAQAAATSEANAQQAVVDAQAAQAGAEAAKAAAEAGASKAAAIAQAAEGYADQAENKALAAAASAQTAATSAREAEDSAAAAKRSEVAADAYATGAYQNAEAATDRAQDAEAAAKRAENARDGVAQSERASAQSASAAAASAASAAAAQKAAEDSASRADATAQEVELFAGQAESSATSASISAGEAERRAFAAATSEMNAANSATEASNSAGKAAEWTQYAENAAEYVAQARNDVRELESSTAQSAAAAATSATAAQTAEANAKAAQKAAEDARDAATEIVGGDFASKAEAQGYANTAESNANKYTDQQIAAIPTPDVSGQIGSHNTATDAHNDIRLLVEGLTARLNALANSDDTTLDQMAEVVAYIKDNRELIDQITTGKVSVSDIVNNLTTNVTNKPLSAAQGVALKALIDGLTTALGNKENMGLAAQIVNNHDADHTAHADLRELANGAVKKSGDTMTGRIVMPSAEIYGNRINAYIQEEGPRDRLQIIVVSKQNTDCMFDISPDGLYFTGSDYVERTVVHTGNLARFMGVAQASLEE